VSEDPLDPFLNLRQPNALIPPFYVTSRTQISRLFQRKRGNRVSGARHKIKGIKGHSSSDPIRVKSQHKVTINDTINYNYPNEIQRGMSKVCGRLKVKTEIKKDKTDTKL
jgi:hypothetical protein